MNMELKKQVNYTSALEMYSDLYMLPIIKFSNVDIFDVNKAQIHH